MIRISQNECRNLELALRREWLETNGLGAFASSTIAGIHTRRYHGLLVVALKPPVQRYMFLSKLEETVHVKGKPFELSANQYPDVVHPRGFEYLTEFRLDPFPVFTYAVDGIEIEKSVFMVHGENTTVVQYHVKGVCFPGRIELELRPLIAFRDYHSIARENGTLNSTVDADQGSITLTPYQGLPPLHLAHNGNEVTTTGHWYRNFEYDVECERGLDHVEDLFNPCVISFDLRTTKEAVLIASTEPHDVAQANEFRRAETNRRAHLIGALPVQDDFVRDLAGAADQYVVARGSHKTIIAGYHWFSDWGRDTMIAVHGLTLVTGRFDITREILRSFAQHVDRGLIPNRFPDAGEATEYNSVDATLWFFEAVRAYLAYSGDLDFVRDELYPVLNGIVAWHIRGTRHGIKLDANGLLASGGPGLQLTWMDAKVGDWVVTPRQGKPVEIQALWYNALCIMEDLAQKFEDQAARMRYRSMATLAHWSFNRLMWNEKDRCLYDVINAGPPDASIRPNQIFAVSLPHSMLSRERAGAVVETLQQQLLTPYGLRSLAPSDPRYQGRYGGDQRSRDGAYHQGTVWPWLMGQFITAYVKVHDGSDKARRQAEEWLAPLHAYVRDIGLGHIAEIFEGDPPHRPVGCVAQAWSVAELLRTTIEDIHAIYPEPFSVV